MRVVPSFVSGLVNTMANRPGSIVGLGSVALLGALAGCGTDLGTCDMARATQVVYTKDTDGTPYYAGQALVSQSCSGYCHAAGATGAARDGAPHGLNFDVTPVTAQSTEDSVNVLRSGISKVRDEAEDMYGEIEDGAMPPGNIGKRPPQQWKLANGADADLPGIDTDVGKATVRNWLACKAPAISGVTGTPVATQAAAIADSQVVAALPTATGSTFADVYTNALASCSSCHFPAGQFPGLDLSSAAVAYTNLVGKDASASSVCAGKGKLVVANDCDNSILYQKLKPNPMCGVRMPLTGPPFLSDAAIAAVCSWIMAGAKQ